MEDTRHFLKKLPWGEIRRTISIIRGAPLGRGGILCLAGGVGALTGFWQHVIVSVLQTFGIKVRLPEVPLWLNFSVGFFLTVLGVGMLLWNVRQGTKTEPVPTSHDVSLYAKFRDLITDSDLDFFRTHSFGNTFRYDRIDSIDALAHNWTGARYEFNDRAINESFYAVKQAAYALNSEIALKTYPVATNTDLATVMRENWNDFDVPLDVYDTISALNLLAHTFVESVDEFERLATGRLIRE